MAEREPGFYWVRILSDMEWEPAQWDGRAWTVLGSLADRPTVAEIDERRIERQEDMPVYRETTPADAKKG